jgi:hypothetical protein
MVLQWGDSDAKRECEGNMIDKQETVKLENTFGYVGRRALVHRLSDGYLLGRQVRSGLGEGDREDTVINRRLDFFLLQSPVSS